MRRFYSRFLKLSAPILTTGLLLSVAVAPAHAAPRQQRSVAPPAVQQTPEPLIVVVSLRRQRLTVFDKDGGVVETSPVSSGTAEFPTPTGIFSVIGKEVEHESNIYDGAQMPFMQRLTWTGTAMHAGHLPGYPASHGCIRLPHGFSEKLFGITQINTRVIVTSDDAAPRPISHPKLFVPPVEPLPANQPMVQAVISKVASLAVTPVLAAPMPAANPGQLRPTARAKAKFADTARLFDAIKPAEAARGVVWENVKAANRALEAAKSDINSLQSAIEDAGRDAEKLKKAKGVAEAQLAAVMKKAEAARTQAAIDAVAKAEDAAEVRLLDAVAKHDAAIEAAGLLRSGMPVLTSKRQAAETARRALDDDLKRSNQALKDAQAAYSVSKREDNRYSKPVSVFVSRKEQRLYVRQGFDPVLEVPVVIDQPSEPLGTHLYTAMSVKNGTALTWSVMSFNMGEAEEPVRRGKGQPQATVKTPSTAARALDRIQFPPEALEAISDVVKPGSSLIISDDSTSQYFGGGTDFTVSVK